MRGEMRTFVQPRPVQAGIGENRTEKDGDGRGIEYWYGGGDHECQSRRGSDDGQTGPSPSCGMRLGRFPDLEIGHAFHCPL